MAATRTTQPTAPLAELGDQLIDAIDADAGARKLNDVPLRIMRLSADALALAKAIDLEARGPIRADVQVAIDLIRTGLRGAHTCIEANLAGVRDDAEVRAVRAEVEAISARGRAL